MSRHLGEDWLLPTLDEFNRRWFTAGAITIQACGACGELQHPPEEVCGSCQSWDLGWRECAGEGRIESFAVVAHPLRPSLEDHVPYAVVVVSLTDAPGVNVIGNVINIPAREVTIGQTVRATFQRVEDTQMGEVLQIPQWEVV
jgi:uncharacterized OB-fold protein